MSQKWWEVPLNASSSQDDESDDEAPVPMHVASSPQRAAVAPGQHQGRRPKNSIFSKTNVRPAFASGASQETMLNHSREKPRPSANPGRKNSSSRPTIAFDWRDGGSVSSAISISSDGDDDENEDWSQRPAVAVALPVSANKTVVRKQPSPRLRKEVNETREQRTNGESRSVRETKPSLNADGGRISSQLKSPPPRAPPLSPPSSAIRRKRSKESIEDDDPSQLATSPSSNTHRTIKKRPKVMREKEDEAISLKKVKAQTDQSRDEARANSVNRSEGRPHLSVSSEEADEDHVDVGTHVYARWTGKVATNQYFWGVVTKKTPHGDSFVVSIKFDDKDRRYKVLREDYETAASMMNSYDRAELERMAALEGLVKRGLMAEEATADDNDDQAVAGQKGNCESCEFCSEEPCFRCHGCREGTSCLRKRMCQMIPMETKALPAVGFPDGWRFALHRQRQHPADGPCLVLLAPNGVRRYRSIEKAVNHNPKRLEGLDIQAFHQYIGIVQEGATSGTAEYDTEEEVASDFAHKLAVDAAPSALRVSFDYCSHLCKLRHEACGICVMCDKPDCGLCLGCSFDEVAVCLHKLCCRRRPSIPLRRVGWSCYVLPSDADSDAGEPLHPDLAALAIRFVSPKNRVFTWESAPFAVNKRGSVVERSSFLRDFFGLTYLHKLAVHPLLNRGYRREWLDVKDRHRSIEGVITECYLSDEDELFTVRLDRKSVDQMNAANQHYRANMFMRKIVHRDAVGGSFCFQQYHRLPRTDAIAGQYLSWNVPCDVNNNVCSGALPCRTFSYRGWRLKLQVASSQIDHHGANRGCFVMCESVSPSTEHLDSMELSQGEFIDLGVYGRPEDCIPHQRFRCKDFVHSHKAQYSFGRRDETLDELFDINDTVLTAQLNVTAQRNALPFVNETGVDEHPCVIAEDDPAGQVHYLLGSYFSKLVFKKGQTHELKIDYGVHYEKVRIKNNYARVKGAELERLRKEIEEEDSGFIDEYDDLPLSVITEHITFLETFAEEQVSRGIVASREARERALFVAILASKRAEIIERKFSLLAADCGSDSDMSAGQKTHRDAQRITARAKVVLESLASMLDLEIKKTMPSKPVFAQAFQRWFGNGSVEFLVQLETADSAMPPSISDPVSAVAISRSDTRCQLLAEATEKTHSDADSPVLSQPNKQQRLEKKNDAEGEELQRVERPAAEKDFANGGTSKLADCSLNTGATSGSAETGEPVTKANEAATVVGDDIPMPGGNVDEPENGTKGCRAAAPEAQNINSIAVKECCLAVLDGGESGGSSDAGSATRSAEAGFSQNPGLEVCLEDGFAIYRVKIRCKADEKFGFHFTLVQGANAMKVLAKLKSCVNPASPNGFGAITCIEPNSPAANAGLRKGDIVLHADPEYMMFHFADFVEYVKDARVKAIEAANTRELDFCIARPHTVSKSSVPD